ncbi:MAG: hypothetical protein ACXIUB_11295 [Wenzhouxiangella sp.]
MRFCGFVLALVLASSVHARDAELSKVQAQADAIRAFAVCVDCYTPSQFAHAAEQFSLKAAQNRSGQDRVYVVNPDSRIVRHFRVSREFDSAFDPLHVDGSMAGSARPAVAADVGEDPQALLAGGFYLAEAVEAEGDTQTIEVILDGVATFHRVLERLFSQAVDVDELSVSEPVSSGFDLIGDGAVSRLRRGLEIGLEYHFTQRLGSLLEPLDDEVVAAFFNIAMASGLFANRYGIPLHFPDGTETMATLKASPLLGNMQQIAWQFESSPRVVNGAGLGNGAVLVPGFFEGYRYEGPQAIGESILALAERIGPSTGFEGECQKTCPAAEENCLLVCN